MTLGKPANNTNHLIALRNKAPLLCNKLYHGKAGSGVIYGNPGEILTRSFSAVMCQSFLVNFLKVPFLNCFLPCMSLVSRKRLVWRFYGIADSKTPQWTLRFEQNPPAQLMKLKQSVTGLICGGFSAKSTIASWILPLQWMVLCIWYIYRNLHSFFSLFVSILSALRYFFCFSRRGHSLWLLQSLYTKNNGISGTEINYVLFHRLPHQK